MGLYPYQLDGVAFLAGAPRRYLADEMGVGKTVQACAACQYLNLKRVLVIAPASTRPNWRYEFESWGPRGATLTAVSYDRLSRNRDNYSGKDYDVVILDEAHYCKSRRAKRSCAALSIAAEAPRAWLLSGTPMPNHPGELWYPLRMLWPDLVDKSYQKFFDRFVIWRATEWGPKPVGLKDKAGLRELLRQVMMRRTVDSIGVQLPPLRVDVQLTPRVDLEEYLGEDAPVLAALAAEERADEASLSRLRKLLGVAKAPFVASVLKDELESGAYGKLVVLAHHRDVLDLLEDALSDLGVVRVDGSSTDRQREQAIDGFRADPSKRVFLGQQTAAGTGVNLQVANELVLLEPSWVPAENHQAIKRIHRIGSNQPCRARIFAISGTLDEAVMRTIANKTRMIDALLTPA